jgi:hypothetical protein
LESRTHVALGRRVAGPRAERRHVRPGPGLLERRPLGRRAPTAALLRRDGIGSCVHVLELEATRTRKRSTPQLVEGIYYHHHEQETGFTQGYPTATILSSTKEQETKARLTIELGNQSDFFFKIGTRSRQFFFFLNGAAGNSIKETRKGKKRRHGGSRKALVARRRRPPDRSVDSLAATEDDEIGSREEGRILLRRWGGFFQVGFWSNPRGRLYGREGRGLCSRNG